MSNDQLESAVAGGAARALRNRAASARNKAAAGVTAIEHNGCRITVLASEARAALNVADDLDEIALKLEGGK